jgi:DNA-binding NarL/FixJ family response regulator
VRQEAIQVLIVDDMPQVRQGLSAMLELAAKKIFPKIKVVGEAKDGKHAIEQAQALHPDVILMDLEMPVLDGFKATQCIKSKDPCVFIIILTIYDDQTTRQQATMAGADGFIAKSVPPGNLVRAILEYR